MSDWVASYVSGVASIVNDAAYESGLTRNDLLADRRTARIARVRFAVYWAVHTALPMNFTQIGRALGDRDQSTIAHGIARANGLRLLDPAFRTLADNLVTKANERAAV